MELKKLDYKCMLKDIKEYIEKTSKEVCSGEAETILEDIKEIIKSWED